MAVRALHVRVTDELVLDAGTCDDISGPRGPECFIRPPSATLFHQVLGYLRGKPDPPRRLSGSMVGREGIAAAALTLRWGSHLAVVLDRDKPIWSEVNSASTSRISDEEMARINIEASAALAEWIDLYRADPSERLYEQLVNRAVLYLPMPKKRPKLKVSEFAALAAPKWQTALSRRPIRRAASVSAATPRASLAESLRMPSSMRLGATGPWRASTQESSEATRCTSVG